MEVQNHRQFAEAPHTKIQTRRYDETRRHILRPHRAPASCRRYAQQTNDRVGLVRHVQGLIFPLDENSELVPLPATHGAKSVELTRRESNKIDVVGDRIYELVRLRATLGQLASQRSGEGLIEGCTIWHAIKKGNIDGLNRGDES